jgi:hypothetical protein
MSGGIAVLAPEPEGSIDWGSSQIADYNPTIAGFPAVSDMLDGRAVGYRVFDPEALVRAERGPAVIISPWRYRIGSAVCAALRQFVADGGLLIGLGEQGMLLDGRPAPVMALGDLFGVQAAAGADGPQVARIEFLPSPISGGLPVGEETSAPIGLATIPGQQGELSGRAYRACGDAVAVARWRRWDRDAGDGAAVGDFCAYRRVGQGAAIWFDDALGVSLFLRCQRGRADATPVLDDLEPVVWRLVCNALAAHGSPLVFALPTPRRRSFSLSHDVCANPWEEAALPGRVSGLAEFERHHGLVSTWYLRTASPGGHMDHPRLRPTAISPAELVARIGDGEVGYHGEQFGWVKTSRHSDLDVAECYRRGREDLERLRRPVVTGSTHFGNFGERYPLDFEGAAEAGFLLWRNSYKRSGLTPMRPYRLPTAAGGPITGLLGYVDAICEDVAAEDITAPPFSAAADKARVWLEIAGGGHLFVHAHAVQYCGLGPRRRMRSWLRSSAVMIARRRLSSGRARYRRACRLLGDAGLACLTHEQVAGHRQRLDLLRIDTEAVEDGLSVRVQAPFTGLTLATLEARPLTVIDGDGRELTTAVERSGDWSYLTVTGMPTARARRLRLAAAVAAGLA